MYNFYSYDAENQVAALNMDSRMWSEDRFTTRPNSLVPYFSTSVDFLSPAVPPPPSFQIEPDALRDQGGCSHLTNPLTPFNLDGFYNEHMSQVEIFPSWNLERFLIHDPPSQAMLPHASGSEGTPLHSPSISDPPVERATSNDLQHNYRRIAESLDHGTLDALLEMCVMPNCMMKVYRCLFPGCNGKLFQRRCTAREHVHSHLAPTKLFECITCSMQFTSESIAKRHRDTRAKQYPCPLCHKRFRRKDYRNLHQRKRCCERISQR